MLENPQIRQNGINFPSAAAYIHAKNIHKRICDNNGRICKNWPINFAYAAIFCHICGYFTYASVFRIQEHKTYIGLISALYSHIRKSDDDR